MYCFIFRFIDEGMIMHRGFVINSLLDPMRTFVDEFRTFLIQQDDLRRDGQLTIQRLHFSIDALKPSLEICAWIVTTATSPNSTSAKLLSEMYDALKNFSKSKYHRDLLLSITKSTAAPYLAMLSQWLYEGTTNDPCGEFMIRISAKKNDEGSKTTTKDGSFAYWENKYRIIESLTPKFLESEKDNILRCGKYWNIIRQCGK